MTTRKHHEQTAAAPGQSVRTLTVAQAGALLGISRSLAYAAVADGSIPSIRIGRRILVPAAALHALLNETPPTRS